MSANPNPGSLSAGHHGGRIPADPHAVALLHCLIAGEVRLLLYRNGVDVGSCCLKWDRHVTTTGLIQHVQQQVTSSWRAFLCNKALERIDPFLRLIGVVVGYLAEHSVYDWPVQGSH